MQVPHDAYEQFRLAINEVLSDNASDILSDSLSCGSRVGDENVLQCELGMGREEKPLLCHLQSLQSAQTKPGDSASNTSLLDAYQIELGNVQDGLWSFLNLTELMLPRNDTFAMGNATNTSLDMIFSNYTPLTTTTVPSTAATSGVTGSFLDYSPHGYDWLFLFVVFFIFAGGLGNILVCLAVALDRKLQNVTNYFLFSLAIADLLVSLFVMPMGAIPAFLGE